MKIILGLLLARQALGCCAWYQKMFFMTCCGDGPTKGQCLAACITNKKIGGMSMMTADPRAVEQAMAKLDDQPAVEDFGYGQPVPAYFYEDAEYDSVVPSYGEPMGYGVEEPMNYGAPMQEVGAMGTRALFYDGYCGVRLYQHYDGKGWSIQYDTRSGNQKDTLYELGDDQMNHISSVKVLGNNCAVKLYERFGGEGRVITVRDNKLSNIGNLNDRVRSLELFTRYNRGGRRRAGEPSSVELRLQNLEFFEEDAE